MPRKAPTQAIPKKKKAPQDWTSNASRKRRMPTCSLASLKALEDEVTLESDFLGSFGQTSESHFTWGKTETTPIVATKKKRRAVRFTKDMYGSELKIHALFGLVETDNDGRPNGPERSWFLRWPLEVREQVYRSLVVWDEAIVIKHDLGQVESDNLRCLPILRVCRQIKAEAESYMYRHNVFRAVNRNPRITYHLHESFVISPYFLPLVRNLIFECTQKNWGNEWYDNATTAIRKLVIAKTPLQSLTLVLVPQQMSVTEQGIGIAKSPITFANFFWPAGPLMQAFKGLRCKTLNVIIKKNRVVSTPAITVEEYLAEAPTQGPVTEETGEEQVGKSNDVETICKAGRSIHSTRFFFSIDLTYSGVGETYSSRLSNEESVKLRHQKRKDIIEQICGLKARFERIFEDSDNAIEMGLCREMEVGEPMFTLS